MIDINIPLMRGLKIGSKDKYIIGIVSDVVVIHKKDKTEYEVTIKNKDEEHKVHYETLAIHFKDMIDSENNPIFASLREDGKGGDNFMFENEKFVVWYSNSIGITATNLENFESNCHDSLYEWFNYIDKNYDLKVIGIQK